MTDFTNLQVYGVPVLTYGLIGITTGVLAYATSIGMGDKLSKTMESISEITANPAGALSEASIGEQSEAKQPATDSNIEALNPFSLETPLEKPSETPIEKPSETPIEKVGGKRRRKKTPKSKKTNKNNKSKKAKLV